MLMPKQTGVVNVKARPAHSVLKPVCFGGPSRCAAHLCSCLWRGHSPQRPLQMEMFSRAPGGRPRPGTLEPLLTLQPHDQGLPSLQLHTAPRPGPLCLSLETSALPLCPCLGSRAPSWLWCCVQQLNVASLPLPPLPTLLSSPLPVGVASQTGIPTLCVRPGARAGYGADSSKRLVVLN